MDLAPPNHGRFFLRPTGEASGARGPVERTGNGRPLTALAALAAALLLLVVWIDHQRTPGRGLLLGMLRDHAASLRSSAGRRSARSNRRPSVSSSAAACRPPARQRPLPRRPRRARSTTRLALAEEGGLFRITLFDARERLRAREGSETRAAHTARRAAVGARSPGAARAAGQAAGRAAGAPRWQAGPRQARGARRGQRPAAAAAGRRAGCRFPTYMRRALGLRRAALRRGAAQRRRAVIVNVDAAELGTVARTEASLDVLLADIVARVPRSRSSSSSRGELRLARRRTRRPAAGAGEAR